MTPPHSPSSPPPMSAHDEDSHYKRMHSLLSPTEKERLHLFVSSFFAAPGPPPPPVHPASHARWLLRHLVKHLDSLSFASPPLFSLCASLIIRTPHMLQFLPCCLASAYTWMYRDFYEWTPLDNGIEIDGENVSPAALLSTLLMFIHYLCDQTPYCMLFRLHESSNSVAPNVFAYAVAECLRFGCHFAPTQMAKQLSSCLFERLQCSLILDPQRHTSATRPQPIHLQYQRCVIDHRSASMELARVADSRQAQIWANIHHAMMAAGVYNYTYTEQGGNRVTQWHGDSYEAMFDVDAAAATADFGSLALNETSAPQRENKPQPQSTQTHPPRASSAASSASPSNSYLASHSNSMNNSQQTPPLPALEPGASLSSPGGAVSSTSLPSSSSSSPSAAGAVRVSVSSPPPTIDVDICPHHLWNKSVPATLCPKTHLTYIEAIAATMVHTSLPYSLQEVPPCSYTFKCYFTQTQRHPDEWVLVLPYPGVFTRYKNLLGPVPYRQSNIAYQTLYEMTGLNRKQSLIQPSSSDKGKYWLHFAATGTSNQLSVLMQAVVWLVEQAEKDTALIDHKAVLSLRTEWKQFVSIWKQERINTGRIKEDEPQKVQEIQQLLPLKFKKA